MLQGRCDDGADALERPIPRDRMLNVELADLLFGIYSRSIYGTVALFCLVLRRNSTIVPLCLFPSFECYVPLYQQFCGK